MRATLAALFEHSSVWFAQDLAAFRATYGYVVLQMATTAGFYAACVGVAKLLAVYRDRLFRRVAILAILFFFVCGTSRLTAIWTERSSWGPALDLAVEVLRGLLALAMGVVMLGLLPTIARLPSHTELEAEIAERRQAEAAATEISAKLHAFIDSIRDYAVYQLDLDGMVRSWNPGGERIFGYTEQEIVGRQSSILFTPQDQAAGVPEQTLQTVRETGRYDSEGLRVRKDGSQFWAHVVIRPVMGPGGDLAGYAKVTRDLTETRELEARCRMLLDAAPDAIVLVDAQGRIDYLNAQAERLFGHEMGAIRGQPAAMLVPAESGERQAAYLRRLFADGIHPAADSPPEILGLHRDGSEFPLEFSVSSLVTKDGRMLLFVLRDLTERRKTEARFRLLLEGLPDAIVIVDQDSEIEYVNAQAEAMFGYERAEILGKTVDTLVPPKTRNEQAVYRDSFFADAHHPRADAPPEILGLRKDGSDFPLEFSVSPLETPDGRLLLFAVRDLTEKRKAEARFQALLEAVPDAIVMTGPDGRIQFVNKQAETLYGYPRSELLGQPSEMLSPQRIRQERVANRNRLFAESEHSSPGGSSESVGLRKDGTEFPTEFSFSPLEVAGGKSFLFAVRDISERLKAETRFRSLLEAAPDAIFIHDRRGVILYMNRRAEEIFRFDRATIVGKPAYQLIPERLRAARALERETIFKNPALIQPGFSGEYLCLRGDGSEFLVEAQRSPLETAEGLLILTSVRDVTERKKTEERIRALLEAVPDAILMYSYPDRIEYVNSSAERLYGYERSELIGQSVDMLIPERFRDERHISREAMFRMPSGEAATVTGEHICVRKDGSEFGVEASVTPLQTPDGTMLLGSVRDITERKKSETEFRAMLDSAPDAIVIFRRDATIEFVNAQAERLFGYARDELIGRAGDLLVPKRLREGREQQMDRLFGELRRTEIAADAGLAGMRKDGTEFPVECTLSPLETRSGWVYLIAVRDVSVRLKTEARFRALLESAPDAMVIVNSAGVIELTNLQTEKLFGYRGTELVGQPVEILVPQKLHSVHEWHRNVYFSSPKQRQMGAELDLMAVRKEGSQFPVEISLSPLDGPNGVSVTAAIRDITERKAAAQQLAEKMSELRQSNEALEQFAHIASHDLQEPLRMVASYTQLLAKRYKGRLDSDADEFIGYAVDGTQRMKRLIEDLLRYSRAGKGAPPVREFESEAAVKEALLNLGAAILDSKAQVTWDRLPKIRAVESQVVQIFQNLIGNAIKYMGSRQPVIRIAASSTETEWIFSVADNGIGIEPRHFERIFLIFQRLHGRGEYEGTGIGLAICQRILQQQGGRIWVESEPGQGSTFFFALPMR